MNKSKLISIGLSILSAAGVGVTAWLAGKAAIKVKPKIDKLNEESENGKAKVKDVVKTIAKDCVPVTIVGVATIGCIVTETIISQKQQASILAAAAVVERSYMRYKDKIREKFGIDVEKEVKAAIAKEDYKELPEEKKTLYDENEQFWDEYRGYFNTSMRKFLEAQIELVKRLNGYNRYWKTTISLNEFYELLGVEKIDKLDKFGWSTDYLMEGYEEPIIDIYIDPIELDDGMVVNVIHYEQEPIVGYDDDLYDDLLKHCKLEELMNTSYECKKSLGVNL